MSHKTTGLLDRYLQATRDLLPGARGEDIVRELREDLLSQIEERQAELVRPLDDAGLEAILLRRGHPVEVATRHVQNERTLSFGRQLIGPLLFPLYQKILGLTVGLTAIVVTIIQLVTSGGVALRPYLFPLLVQAGIITLVLALADAHMRSFPASWNPTALPPSAARVSRAASIFRIVVGGLILAWLLSAKATPQVVFGPFRLAPIWASVWPFLVLLTAASLVQPTVNLARPAWTRFRTIAVLVFDAAWLAFVVVLIAAGEWVVLGAPPAGDRERLLRLLASINRSIFYTLLAVAIITAGSAGFAVRRLLREPGASRRTTPRG